LNNLGYIYRSVNQSLVDTERLLKLLNEPTEVEDTPGAPDLIVEDGEIEFGQKFRLPHNVVILIRLTQTMSAFLTITERPH
jgi:ABC-type transport system involved in Fe-S cluster assembly fused permease/ATPase subunit